MLLPKKCWLCLLLGVKQTLSSLVFWGWESVCSAQVENLAQLEEGRKKRHHIYTSVCDVCTYTYVYTDRGKDRMREETQWMLSISFCLSKSSFDILFNTLPKGGTFFFVFLHFGSQSASSGLIQIYQAWREPVFFFFFPFSLVFPLSLSYLHHHCCLAGASLYAVSSSVGSPFSHHHCLQPQDALIYLEKTNIF